MSQASPEISICIPVKDFDVHPLAEALLKEIRLHRIPADLLILEDGSSAGYLELNKPLEDHPEVRRFIFDKNKGRAAARNFLGANAQGAFLLFIDADSLPLGDQYLRTYLQHRDTNTVLCGGTHYSTLYRNRKTKLHWKYGINREVFSAVAHNGGGFKSNNFCMSRSAFVSNPFNEHMVLYGHEDTLFGIMAQKKGLNILSINNPVIHTGLEANAGFLEKTEESISSLMQVVQGGELSDAELKQHFKLWETYAKLKKYKLLCLLNALSVFKPLIKKSLLRCSGPLLFLDLYKLILLHKQSILIQSGHK